MTPERERELLELIFTYWLDGRRKITARERGSVRVFLDDDYVNFPASWAESEACLREVSGECAVRVVDIATNVDPNVASLWLHLPGQRYANLGEDESRPVALLRAFVAAFGGATA